MADISDDEQIEKPKRAMSDKQKEALKKGRELAKANREAQKNIGGAPPVKPRSKKEGSETLVSEEEPKPEKKKREKKVKVEEVENVVVPEPVKGKRVSRKAVEERSPSPQRPPSPEIAEPVKKTRTPRKKVEKPVEVAQPKPVRQKPSLQFV